MLSFPLSLLLVALDIGSSNREDPNMIRTVIAENRISFQYCWLDFSKDCEPLHKKPISIEYLEAKIKEWEKDAKANERKLKFLNHKVVSSSMLVAESVSTYRKGLEPLLQMIEELQFIEEKAEALGEDYQLPGAIVKKILEDYRLILFGEFHGTTESPKIFQRILEQLVAVSSRPTKVLIECPRSEQKHFDDFISSRDEAFLKATDFFSHAAKDGRTSKAMLSLLNYIAKAGLSITCFDSDRNGLTSQEREQDTASFIRQKMGNQIDSLWIGLTGNLHSRLMKMESTQATWADKKEYWPMASLIPIEGDPNLGLDKVASFNIKFNSGAAYLQTRDEKTGALSSGVVEFKNQNEALMEASAGKPAVFLFNEIYEGHRGFIFIPTITASWPAFSD